MKVKHLLASLVIHLAFLATLLCTDPWYGRVTGVRQGAFW